MAIKDNDSQTLHSDSQDVTDDVNSLLDLMSQAYDKIVLLNKEKNRISVEQAEALYSGADELHNSVMKLAGGIIGEYIPKKTPTAIFSGW